MVQVNRGRGVFGGGRGMLGCTLEWRRRGSCLPENLCSGVLADVVWSEFVGPYPSYEENDQDMFMEDTLETHKSSSVNKEDIRTR